MKKLFIIIVIAAFLLTGCGSSQFYFRAGIGADVTEEDRIKHFDPRVSGPVYEQSPEYRRPIWIDLRGY